MNWNWPATKNNDLCPWYTIIRRCIFAPMAYLGLGLTWLAAAGGWGVKEANEFWRRVR